MAIKNKDGTPLKLTSPNPLGIGQEGLEGKIIFHNWKWKGIVHQDGREINPLKFKHHITKAVSVEPIHKQPEAPVAVIEEPKEESKEEKPVFKNQIIFHYLPAILKTHKDDLYFGEEYTRVKYGTKIKIAGIMLDHSDLLIKFWTETEGITEKSIVFPYEYTDGTPYRGFRWWKVGSVTKKEPGWIVEAMASEIQPDFSD